VASPGNVRFGLSVAGGIYVVRIVSDAGSATKKLVLVR
jgi:hypothetical protein